MVFFSLALEKLRARPLTALNFEPSMATRSPLKRSSLRQKCENSRQTCRIALRLSRRKSAMVLPKVLAREVRGQASEQPHDFHVAVGLSFQLAAGADADEVGVDVELEQIGGVIWRATRLFRHGVLEPEGLEVQRLNESVYESNGIIFGDIFIDGFGEKSNLVTVDALDMSHGQPHVGQRRRTTLLSHRGSFHTVSRCSRPRGMRYLLTMVLIWES
jgi:hypothetical protein